MEILSPPAIHGEQVAGRSAKVRESLLALSKHVGVSTLDVAELLFEAQENNYTSQWGFESLPVYAEKELGLKPRKAQYLARIVRVYKAVGLVRAQIENVAISKLREITTLDPHGSYFNRETKTNEELAEHIVRLITDADEMTVEQVKDTVAKLKGQDGPDRRVIRSYSTDLSSWENVIKPAMEIIRRKLGSAARDDGGNAVDYPDGVCIEAMCADVLADPYNEEPMELPTEMEGLVAEPELPEEKHSEPKITLPKEMI